MPSPDRRLRATSLLRVGAGLLAVVALCPRDALANGLTGFQARHGAEWALREDPSGRPRLLHGGALRWLSGEDALASEPHAIRAKLRELASRFVAQHEELLGIDASILRVPEDGITRAGGGLLWIVRHEVAPGGVPVKGGQVLLVISHGSLVAVSLAGTAPVTADPTPIVAADDAWRRAIQAAGTDPALLRMHDLPSLRFLPGDGGRLVWDATLVELDPPRRLAVLVDARTGAIVSVTDETVEACSPPTGGPALRRVTGGVRPERADQPERAELLRGAAVGGVAVGPDGFFAPPVAPYAGTLAGAAATMSCVACSPPSPLGPAGADGNVDFGSGGADGSGNATSTPADRAVFAHVESVRRQAMRWLSLPYLDNPLPARTNLLAECNAYWDGTGISFFRSSATCANTGEIRDVIVHEWGHGLDDNDGVEPPSLSVDAATGEAVADIAAMLRSRDACIGESFFVDPADGPSATCSGVRDVDELTTGHRRGSPATLTTVNATTLCRANPNYRGPLGRQGHCEGEIFGQAFWHLVQNLRTGLAYADGTPLPDGPLGDDEAWQVAESLYYLSRPLLASYAPASLQSLGMSAYDAFLIADDEGDGVANGTPHAAAIHEAFSHHGIAEDPSAPLDTPGCAGPPAPAFVVSSISDADSGLPALQVSWSDVGAARTRILRADDADDAFLPVASPFGPGAGSFTDRAVLQGRSYRYLVLAESAGGCATAGPSMPGSPGAWLRASPARIDDVALGNGNGVLEGGETASLFLDVTNDGGGAATNLRVTLVSTDPGVTVLPPDTVAYGTVAPGATVPGLLPFTVRAETAAPRFVYFRAPAETDEGCLEMGLHVELGVVDLELAGHTIEEIAGDGNGQWDPGESANLSPLLVEQGLLDAAGVDGSLAFRGAPPPGVTLVRSGASWGTLPPRSPQAAPLPPTFLLASDPTTPARTRVPLSLDVRVAGVPHRVFDVDLVVGGLPPGSRQWTSNLGTSHVATGTPVVVQLSDDDGDGRITSCDIPDVAVIGRDATSHGHLAVVDGGTGLLRWDVRTGPCADVRTGTQLSAGDIDGDGQNEVLVTSFDQTLVCSFRSDGSPFWVSPPLEAASSRVEPYDLDGDGRVEVVTGGVVLDGADGSIRWQQPPPGFFGRSVVGDLDLDGRLEILNMNNAWRWDGSRYGTGSQYVGAFAVLANLDDDPYPEIVSGLNGNTTVLEHDRTVKFVIPEPDTVLMPDHQVCAADFDGDGRAEIAYAAHLEFHVMDDDGSELWAVPMNDPSAQVAGCAVFDFDRDGTPDVVGRDADRLFILDGRDGSLLWQALEQSGTLDEVPVIADVNNDGGADILSTSAVIGGASGWLHCYGNPAWPPARTVWNQVNYSVTHVEDDGGIVSNPFPRWLTANDFRGQDTVCPCTTGLIPEVNATLPACANEDPPPGPGAATTACFHAIVAGGLAPYALSWNFGMGWVDGLGADPCFDFGAPGNWPVALRVEDRNGCRAGAGTIVFLAEPLAVTFPEPAVTCPGPTTCMEATVRGGLRPIELAWDLGDGSPLVTGDEACHAYAAGTWIATVFARDANGCLAEQAHVVTVFDPASLPEVSPRGSARPLLVAKQGAVLRLTFEDTGFETGIYAGSILQLRVTNYTHAATSACRRAGGTATLGRPAGDTYLLAVASACDAPRAEGGYGFSSFGVARPSAAELGTTACP